MPLDLDAISNAWGRMKMRDWLDFFDLSKLKVPESDDKTMERLRDNAIFFQANYLALCSVFFVITWFEICVFLHALIIFLPRFSVLRPWFLLVLLLVLCAAIYFAFIREDWVLVPDFTEDQHKQAFFAVSVLLLILSGRLPAFLCIALSLAGVCVALLAS